MGWVRTVLALGIAVVLRPALAEACMCTHETWFVLPDDGSTGVPTNAAVVVSGLFEFGTPDLRLREAATLTPVPLTLTSFDAPPGRERFVIGRTDVELAPLTDYELTGADVNVLARFTTGDAADLEAPAFTGISGLRAETMAYGRCSPCGNSCVEYQDDILSRLYLEYPEPEGAVFSFLEWRRAADPAPSAWVPLTPYAWWDRRTLLPILCGPQPPWFGPGEEYCARVIALDQAGNTAGGDVEVCTTSVACATAVDAECEPAITCDPIPASEGRCAYEEPDGGSAGGCAVAPRPSGAALLLLLALGLRIRRRA